MRAKLWIAVVIILFVIILAVVAVSWGTFFSRYKCETLRSDEQPIFGPELWRSLHLIAENYPDHPVPEAQKAAKDFIRGFPWMIPCANCGFHFREFLTRQYPQDFLGQKDPDLEGTLTDITKSRDEMIRFFVEAHNNVTRHTDKTAKLWTPEEAKKYYEYGYRCVPKVIHPWETEALKRGRDGTCKTWVKKSDDKGYCKAWEYPTSGPEAESM